ncbi:MULTISPECIES: GNAT family N-acetyltransferase [Parachlamydia]|jgi:GNAT superfamily N-acetyltransferase|uniref:GNAT family N-acetyltransferase n=1 Tax=Parachlamydia TaxID=83551 RepID=UPI0001C17400|nr:GNAT family N-acetyltransferase [Parachlamydia acanthamoebae]EFB41117.1 hypothetical protein pah_c050o081 [Parachlamydia acanthamoebae str. Hall's coccus]
MYRIEKFDLPLPPEQFEKLNVLIDVRDWAYFTEKQEESCWIYVAFDGIYPVGSIVGINTNLVLFAELHSFTVLPSYRGRKIGSQLLASAEQDLITNGCKSCSLFFRFDPDRNQANEKFLVAKGWNPSIHSAQFYLFHSALFDPPWLKHYAEPFAKPFREVFWKDIPKEDITYLKELEEQGSYPFYISPFHEPDKIEPLNSLALYCNREIVGWLVTHRVSPGMIRYQAFYIQHQYQHKGFAIKLLCDSIRLQTQSTVPYAVVEINTQISESSWVQFARKRLAPYAQGCGYMRQSWKRFKENI